MKTKHEEIQRLLHIYLDGMLNEAQHAEMESHLRTCENCRRELDYLQVVMRGIETYPLLETPPNFAEDVISTLQTVSQNRYALELIATLLEVPKFLFTTIVTNLKEMAKYYYLSIVLGIRRTKQSLAFGLSSARDNLKENFSNIINTDASTC